MKHEISRNDWDVSILHYLGLDHIGHLSGPKSPLIPNKLKEMGDVIELIKSTLFEKPWKENLPPLIMVLGDHGMADAGGHGGASLAETVTPVVTIFPSNTNKSLNKNTRHTLTCHPRLIKQHDLASTLSLLSGVPIPRNNIGKFNWGLLNRFLPIDDIEERSKFMCFYNLEQISSCLKSQFSWYEGTKGYKHYLKVKNLLPKPNTRADITKECEMAINEMSGTLEENMSSYNMKWMILGIVILLMNVLMFGSWYIQLFGCEFQVYSLEGIILLFNILHLGSFASTSFIEEEHQSIYFFTISIGIVVLKSNLQKYYSPKKEDQFKSSSDLSRRMINIMIVLFLLRIARTINQTGDKWLHLPDFSDYLQKPENQIQLTIIHAASLLFLIVFRTSRPNFSLPKNKLLQSNLEYVWSVGVLVVAYLAIFIQKIPDGTTLANMFDHFITTLEGRNTYPAQVVYFLSFLYFLLRIRGTETLSNRCEVLLDALLPIFTLLSQSHSTFLIPIILIIEELMFHTLKNVCSDWGSIYYLFGLATYFLMGNSNSLACVDVGAGYIGVTSFNPVIVSLLMAVNTFNGPIIWSLLLYCRLNQSNHHKTKLETVVKTVGLHRACELLFITIICTWCRYHIMVWTVFAPKVLFEMMFTLILSLLNSLVFVITKLFLTENKNKHV